MSIWEIISILLSVVTLILVAVVLFAKTKNSDLSQINGVKTEVKAMVDTSDKMQKQLTEMLLASIKTYNDTMINSLSASTNMQNQQLVQVQNRLDSILKASETSLKEASLVIEKGLDKLTKDNEKKLEEMRVTVDEKLNVSLERRLTESFNIINQRLQSVYEGLGEMKTLATGVGDLKKVLTNVKTRGVWGEMQLGNILEQMLSPDQYAAQVNIKNNGERVDYVVNLPGKDDETIYLPIDAKFPIEDYQRLCAASEIGDIKEVENASKALEKRVKEEAKKICEKYIDVPKTTDFAVMFVAIEGLYAEILRKPGLAEQLQQQYKVVVSGPTTLSALLSSLQLGFKTLSIEKRSSEIWALLGTFKQEFSRFVELLAKTQKKLSEATSTIEFATKKSMTIQKKLKNVSIDTNSKMYIENENQEDDGEEDE